MTHGLCLSLLHAGAGATASAANSVRAGPARAPPPPPSTPQGSHLTSPAFQLLLHAALRTLIDELGVRTFNAGEAGSWQLACSLSAGAARRASWAPALPCAFVMPGMSWLPPP